MTAPIEFKHGPGVVQFNHAGHLYRIEGILVLRRTFDLNLPHFAFFKVLTGEEERAALELAAPALQARNYDRVMGGRMTWPI